jgi:hypothetical protein
MSVFSEGMAVAGVVAGAYLLAAGDRLAVRLLGLVTITVCLASGMGCLEAIR